MAVEETTEERYLHAMYDALRHLHWDGRHAGTGCVACAILAGVLGGSEFPPYVRYVEDLKAREDS